MVWTFNTTFVTEIILNFPESNHSADIYATNKLLDHDLILGRDILHKLGIIFKFENKTITWQDVLMKPPNCTANNFFVIKESCPIQNTTKRINNF